MFYIIKYLNIIYNDNNLIYNYEDSNFKDYNNFSFSDNKNILNIIFKILNLHQIYFNVCFYQNCCSSIPCKKASNFQIFNNPFINNLYNEKDKYLIIYHSQFIEILEKELFKNINNKENINYNDILQLISNNKKIYKLFYNKWLSIKYNNCVYLDLSLFDKNQENIIHQILQFFYPNFPFKLSTFYPIIKKNYSNNYLKNELKENNINELINIKFYNENINIYINKKEKMLKDNNQQEDFQVNLKENDNQNVDKQDEQILLEYNEDDDENDEDEEEEDEEEDEDEEDEDEAQSLEDDDDEEDVEEDFEEAQSLEDDEEEDEVQSLEINNKEEINEKLKCDVTITKKKMSINENASQPEILDSREVPVIKNENKNKRNKPKMEPGKKRRIKKQMNKHIERLQYDLFVSRHKKEKNKVRALNLIINDLKKKKRNL